MLAVIFDADSVYGLIADEVFANLPWYRRRGRRHKLCLLLEQAAETVSPGTHVAVLEDELFAALRETSMPRFLAKAVAVAAGSAANRLIGSLGTDQIVVLLRVLILLVCPNFERCPTQQKVCSFFAKPAAEDAVRSILTE